MPRHRRRSSAAAAPATRVATAAPYVLNAFYDRGSIVLVSRGADGEVDLRRMRGGTAYFLRKVDVTHELRRALVADKHVHAVTEVGSWYRVEWSDRDYAEWAGKRLESIGVQTYEGTVSSIRRLSADLDLHIAKPRRVYLDIETDSRVAPSLAADGEARVLCWALVDEHGGEWVGVLAEDTNEAERALLQQLWARLEPYDQVVAWYGDGFDFPVIKARTERAGLHVPHKRWLWLDQMEAFDRMNTMAAKSGDEKSSLALQSVAMEIVGEGKNDFDASLTWEAWEAGGAQRQEMVDYCLQDTRLLPRIEERTGFCELLQTLCEATGAFPDTRGLSPSSQVENYLLRIALANDVHFPTRWKERDNEWVPFKGAFVMDPAFKGFGYNVHVADFSRLYPSIIMSWNMSPDTKVAPDVVSYRAQPQAMFDAVPVNAPSNTCTAVTGTMFETDRDGLLPIALREILRLRSKWKKEMAKHSVNTPRWVEAYRRSTAYKIAANSFYGVIGSPMSRFYDRDVGESVTQCGVWLIQQTIKEAEARGMEVVYGDTDSLFVRGATREEFETFVAWCNSTLYPGLLAGLGCKHNFVELGYEKAFRRIVFSTDNNGNSVKKRYVASYWHYDGQDATEESTPEIKGLEFKRGDSTKLARDFQAEVAYALVGYKRPAVDPDNPQEIVDIINRWKYRIHAEPLDADLVIISKRLSKPITEYVRNKKLDGDYALRPPHVEIAAAMAEQGKDIRVGTRIGYFCTDGAASPKVYLPADQWTGHNFDRFALWENFVWPPTMRLCAGAFPNVDWSQWTRTRPSRANVRRPRLAPGQTGFGFAKVVEPPVDYTVGAQMVELEERRNDETEKERSEECNGRREQGKRPDRAVRRRSSAGGSQDKGAAEVREQAAGDDGAAGGAGRDHVRTRRPRSSVRRARSSARQARRRADTNGDS
jgi:DNA polymerase I